MATTAQKVFSAALALMDEQGSPGDYEKRALPVINALCGECFPLSQGWTAAKGERPACPAAADLGSAVGVDDYLARTVLPYGLAAQLLLDENPAAASFLQQRYEELLRGSGRGFPAAAEPIGSVYGGFSAGGEV